MGSLKCIKCEGQLKEQNKIITTVDPSDNYEMKKAKLYVCVSCRAKYHLEI